MSGSTALAERVPTLSTVPWTRRLLAGVAALFAAGAGLVLLGWFGASGEGDPGDQVGDVAVAVLGALIGLAALMWAVVDGRRAVAVRTRLLLGAAPEGAPGNAVSPELVSVPGGTWLHRADCALLEGRHIRPAVPAAGAPGRRPCPACDPRGDHPAAESPAGSTR